MCRWLSRRIRTLAGHRLTRRLGLVFITLGALGAAGPLHAEPLSIDGRAALAVWPAVSLLVDPTGDERAEQLALQPQRFERPVGTPSNLGRRDEVTWLRFALQVPAGEPVHRVLEIDYPSLNRVDLFLLREGRIVGRQRMGNELPLADRPLPTRTHAAALTLAAGEHEIMLRVQTLTSLVLPITLRTPEGFTVQESRVQLGQGMILGLALCMLLYSLLHWMNLRDVVFLQYALMLGGNVLFVLSYFGVGALYLWPGHPDLSMTVAPMGIMVAVAAGALFMRSSLAVHEVSPPIAFLMRAISAIALLALLATATGLLGYRAAQTLVTVLGLVITVVIVPVAFLRARRGERVAQFMLFGWVFYMVGAVTAAGLLRGLIEPTVWTQHVYPLTMMVEMTAWMGVLGLRVQELHRGADRARMEAETQRTLAQTDALTGLPNRRGLQQQLNVELARCSPDRMLALYLLDLDGFKAVNDRWGHDVGDALLVEVSRRLQSLLRGSDVVARLGGDEFVVLAPGLPDDGAATRLGHKLLAAFEIPFEAGGRHCLVGLTAGYALAPQDGLAGEDLLKCADGAMYAGKQAGRHRVQRADRSLAAA